MVRKPAKNLFLQMAESLLRTCVAEREIPGGIVLGRVNVDENPSTTTRFEINSIPTLLLVERGREIDRISGVQTKAEIARPIARILRTGSRAAS